VGERERAFKAQLKLLQFLMNSMFLTQMQRQIISPSAHEATKVASEELARATLALHISDWLLIVAASDRRIKIPVD
jgi:hypothetical protein